MATRNRTLLFVQYRNTFSRSSPKHTRQTGPSFDERAGLLGNQNTGEVIVEMSALPPRWVDIVDEIEEDMGKLKSKGSLFLILISCLVSQLEILHKKNVLPGFEDKVNDEASIDLLTEDITKLFQSAQHKIKRVQSENVYAEGQNQMQVGKNIQISLATKLQDLSTNFRKTQSNYLNRLRGRETKGRNNLLSEIDKENQEEFDDLDAVFTDAQLQVIAGNEREISNREKGINDIVKSIHGLAAIFKDLQTMVIDQGTILDRIDYNIEQTNVNVQDAHGELVKAFKYQNNKMGKVCIVVLGVIVVILLAVVILKKRNAAAAST